MRRLIDLLPRRRLRVLLAFWPLLALQATATLFFVWETLGSVLGLRTRAVSWQVHEMIEIGAASGLVLGTVMGAVALRGALRRTKAAERKLARASSAFAEVLEDRFSEWGLTPAERDVALFTIKGLSLAEIAELRSTSDGTVKSQSNAIYRKAGVGNRAQLVSLFIEDLMAEDAPRRKA